MKRIITPKALLLNLLLTLCLTACNDDDEPNPDNDGQGACRLTKEMFDDDYYDEFEYNAQGYITKATEKEVGSNEVDYYSLFIYNANNQLTKLESYEEGQLEDYVTFEYTNNLATTAKYYNGGGTLDYTYTYKYDGNKRLIEEADDDGYVSKYTYNTKGNVIKLEFLDNGTLNTQITYENYDDKFSPYASFKGLPVVFTTTSKNNPGKKTYSSDDNNDGIIQPDESDITTYTYKYNEKGFPTEITETDSFGTEVSTYVYDCN
jgi:YD repeat-containing protein